MVRQRGAMRYALHHLEGRPLAMTEPEAAILARKLLDEHGLSVADHLTRPVYGSREVTG